MRLIPRVAVLITPSSAVTMHRHTVIAPSALSVFRKVLSQTSDSNVSIFRSEDFSFIYRDDVELQQSFHLVSAFFRF
jgi:hypothetical protein